MFARSLLALATILVWHVEVNAAELEVGKTYNKEQLQSSFPNITIVQIVDENNMVVEVLTTSSVFVANGRGDGSGYLRTYKSRQVVWCKVPTKGLADDKKGYLFDFFKNTRKVTVTGTTKYETASGSKTVIVLEPYVEKEKGKEKEQVKAGQGKAAYDAFPEVDRPKLVKDWESELEALKRAIKEDEGRLANAKTANEKQRFTRLIAEYKEKLKKHEINDPPYIQKN